MEYKNLKKYYGEMHMYLCLNLKRVNSFDVMLIIIKYEFIQ